MKSKYLYHTLLLCLISLFFTGCSTMGLTGGQQYTSSSIYKGGYWGEWETKYSLTAKSSFTENAFSLLLYNKSDHPSDFETRVTATKFVKKDGDWLEYTGTVELLTYNERIDQMNNFYSSKVNLYGIAKKHITFPCVIRISKPIKNIFKKHGTINIFYNGVARAYSF